jgi:hypothetical protein
LGYTKEGIIWLVISLFTCGIVTGVLGLIEGIIYLTKSDQEFYQTYQQQKKHGFKKSRHFRDFLCCVKKIRLLLTFLFVNLRSSSA